MIKMRIDSQILISGLGRASAEKKTTDFPLLG